VEAVGGYRPPADLVEATVSGLVAVEKACTRCGEIKRASEFYRNQRRQDGLQSWCAECRRADMNKRNAPKRAEDPDGFRARINANVRASRARTGNVRGKDYMQARDEALRRLRAAHPDEWEQLLRVVKYERGLL